MDRVRWQVKCCLSATVGITVRSKIRYKGHEYSSLDKLPAEARAAYERALSDGATKKKFVINGQEFTNENTMPPDLRRLCDDVMSVIENNGEVTIPSGNKTEPLLSKRELIIVGTFALGIVALVVARLLIG